MAQLAQHQLTAAQGAALVEGRPADDALLTLLAHMVVSDGVVHEREIGFLTRVRPGLSPKSLADWARRRAAEPLDLASITSAIVEPDDQWRCLRFVARMAWKDGELAREERDLLQQLASAFALPGDAVGRVLREMSPLDKERFDSRRLLEVLTAMNWNAVQLASGNLVSEDLAAILPETAEVVARVGLERVEVMGITTDGIVARFQEGPAFLWWSDIVAWTRARALGESVRLHTESASYGLVDHRLTGLAAFLDRLLDPQERRKGEEPVVELIRGE